MRKYVFATATALAAFIAAGLSAGQAIAADKLTLYCSPQIEWCKLMVEAFEKETGIKVAMTRKSSGETFAQIKAESSNPKGDVWWGGTGDPHLQAAEEGLTMEYKSPLLDKLHPWAQSQAEDASYKTVGIYAGALGFGYNTELLKSKNLPVPKCWKDLANPAYKGEIQVANPNSSGTSYTTLATLVQLFGEDEAFAFYAEMHKNINQYTKSGSAPIKAAARGETTIGITFMHDMVTQVVKGFPIEIVAPCEGTGYEIGSMSIIKGGRNPESAKKFYDFALNAEIQMRAKEAKAYQVPSNSAANPPKEAPDLSKLKLIDYDFKKYGSSAERRRLLAKWDKEIKTLPR
ncbi:MAG: ABC transporter substrate-binding protein [Alphaproteobacteria bacterium]|nr:ABC transporter substrate-binding protein [Alphaproteobacteria bacterium]